MDNFGMPCVCTIYVPMYHNILYYIIYSNNIVKLYENYLRLPWCRLEIETVAHMKNTTKQNCPLPQTELFFSFKHERYSSYAGMLL